MMVRKTCLCLLSAFALTGCGYRMGSLVSPDLKSVHVRMFDNRGFRHEIEVALTQAVKDEIARRTHLSLKNAAAAETVLSGTITNVQSSVTSYDARDDVFSQSLTVTIAFEWRRKGDGRILARASGLSIAAEAIALREETQGTATTEAFRDLAELIVERMQEDF